MKSDMSTYPASTVLCVVASAVAGAMHMVQRLEAVAAGLPSKLTVVLPPTTVPRCIEGLM
jgi:hypothetical protein